MDKIWFLLFVIYKPLLWIIYRIQYCKKMTDVWVEKCDGHSIRFYMISFILTWLYYSCDDGFWRVNCNVKTNLSIRIIYGFIGSTVLNWITFFRELSVPISMLYKFHYTRSAILQQGPEYNNDIKLASMYLHFFKEITNINT